MSSFVSGADAADEPPIDEAARPREHGDQGDPTAPISLFSEAETAMLERVATTLGHKTSKQLSELSHRERAWAETATRSMIPYEFARDLSL